jgi:hypothetical protein
MDYDGLWLVILQGRVVFNVAQGWTDVMAERLTSAFAFGKTVAPQGNSNQIVTMQGRCDSYLLVLML